MCLRKGEKQPVPDLLQLHPIPSRRAPIAPDQRQRKTHRNSKHRPIIVVAAFHHLNGAFAELDGRPEDGDGRNRACRDHWGRVGATLVTGAKEEYECEEYSSWDCQGEGNGGVPYGIADEADCHGRALCFWVEWREGAEWGLSKKPEWT